MNSDKKDFKVGDVWLRRDGKKATILMTTYRGSGRPVVYVTEIGDGKDFIEAVTEEGLYSTSSTGEWDLIKKYEPPVGPEEIYVIVRRADGWLGEVYRTDEEMSSDAHWACVKYRRVDD